MPFYKIWRKKPKYVSQRDTTTCEKLKQRNLYVPRNDPSLVNKNCECCNNTVETMEYFSNCVEIRDRYWAEIYNLMKVTDINYIKTDAFLILGVLGPEIVIDKEGAAILALA